MVLDQFSFHCTNKIYGYSIASFDLSYTFIWKECDVKSEDSSVYTLFFYIIIICFCLFAVVLPVVPSKAGVNAKYRDHILQSSGWYKIIISTRDRGML